MDRMIKLFCHQSYYILYYFCQFATKCVNFVFTLQSVPYFKLLNA